MNEEGARVFAWVHADVEAEGVDHGQPDFLVAEVFDGDAVFDGTEISARVPFPAKAEMGLGGFVDEDGVIWVHGLDDEGVMAFTDFGVDSLIELIKIHREATPPQEP